MLCSISSSHNRTLVAAVICSVRSVLGLFSVANERDWFSLRYASLRRASNAGSPSAVAATVSRVLGPPLCAATMKRVWRLSLDTAQASQLYGMRLWSNPKSFLPSTNTTTAFTQRHMNTLQQTNMLPDIATMFTQKKEDFTPKAMLLRDDLVREASDSVRVLRILNDNSDSLTHSDSFLELLNQLDSWPSLALQVFNWRRNIKDFGSNPITAWEYSKGIRAAGRSRSIDFAVQIFNEAATKGVKTTDTYNALMGAFMFNGTAHRCYSLFLDMKKDPTCSPSIVTYNIVIAGFGRMMLVDYMETTFKEINELHLSPNICTYNCLLLGYISAWMWDDMDRVFQMLKSGLLEPNMQTYSLMIRGYAHAGNLVKMEEIYSLAKDHVNKNDKRIIRTMIVAYCKSSETDRVKKIEALLKLIPEDDYRPWLNVLLIRLYAQEDWLEGMENAINEAFKHGTPVTNVSIMRCIIATYFRCDALENLEIFVRRAAFAGWRICHSLYHCKMVMYASQKNFQEMQNVLEEMNSVHLSCNRETMWIMYKAYKKYGQKSMVLKILGQMFKHGYEIPYDAFPS